MECLRLLGLFQKLDFVVFYRNISQLAFVGPFQRLSVFFCFTTNHPTFDKVFNKPLWTSSFCRSALWTGLSWAVPISARLTYASPITF